MSASDTIAVLNRVLMILRRSFPQYLQYSRPYIPSGCGRTTDVLREIAMDQDSLAERVSDQVVASGALPDHGEFPMEFTDTHDLGIDYLIREAIGYQKQDVAALEACANTPALTPATHALAAEALGMTKGHLAALEELPLGACESTVVRNGHPAHNND